MCEKNCITTVFVVLAGYKAFPSMDWFFSFQKRTQGPCWLTSLPSPVCVPGMKRPHFPFQFSLNHYHHYNVAELVQFLQPTTGEPDVILTLNTYLAHAPSDLTMLISHSHNSPISFHICIITMDMVDAIRKQLHMWHLHELVVQLIFYLVCIVITPKPTPQPTSTRNDSSV